jgi:hypothetical protein
LTGLEAVRRLKAYRDAIITDGFKWICLEHNDYGNANVAAEYRQACLDENVIFTIWVTRAGDYDPTPSNVRQAVVNSQAAGILIEGEVPAESAPGVPNPQAVNWPDMIFHLQDLPVYKGTITNNAPFTHHDGAPWPEMVAPLIDAGWSYHTECYDLTGDPKLWIERRDFFAKQLNVPRTQPAVGLFHGRTAADFPTFLNYENGSVWAAEYLI